MRRTGLMAAGALAAVLLGAACYRPFSPEIVRKEIVRQTGAEPGASFEFKLGGATMRLAKAVVSRAAGEPIRFGGLARVDLAVFEVPPGKEVDFGKLRLWGWDRVIQTRKEGRSLLVLVRTDGKNLGDLVLVAQGEGQVLYGRLKGQLDPGLPTALRRALESTGLTGLKEHLLSAGRSGEGETGR
jgi:hypothetical protein